MEPYKIRNGLQSLIGDDELAAYEKHLYEGWKDSYKYWQDVTNQATKDLEKHWVTLPENK